MPDSLVRRIFEVHFEGGSPDHVRQVIRAYRNGGLRHALEPDVRCRESQPLFIGFGLASMEEVKCRDNELAASICEYLQSIAQISLL